MGGDYDNPRNHNNNNYNRERERDYYEYDDNDNRQQQYQQRKHRPYSNNRRSSDYRSDYDSNEFGDRKSYRNSNGHHHHSKQDNRYRERRSRSRSTERPHSSKDYGNNRHNNYDDDRERRDFNDRRGKRREEIPNKTIMIRNLAPHIIEKEILAEINKYGLCPIDIRILKHKETGQSRGFAFVEFPTIEQAKHLKETTNGVMLIDNEYECSIFYSFPKDNNVVRSNDSMDPNNVVKLDWNCPKCGLNNFKRRDECFKCGAHRDAIIDPSEKIQLPTCVLILNNLSCLTTEETILSTIGALTPLPFKTLRLVADPVFPMTNMCSLELHSLAEATEMKTILSTAPGGLVIDGNEICITYGKRFEVAPVPTVSSILSQHAAASALAAAQWKNMGEAKRPVVQQKIFIKGVEYTKYPPPNYSAFHYDSSTGYYYDQSTGFHYDMTSQYFYNSQTQKYMYYDTANGIYVSVDSSGQAVSNDTPAAAVATADNISAAPTSAAPTTTTTTSEVAATASTSNDQSTSKKSPPESEPMDSAKMAKKIAKDMERWAKSQNQQKEMIKVTQQFVKNNSVDSYETYEPLAADETPVGYSLTSNIERRSISPEEKDPFAIIKEEEQRLTDLSRLACLLCKRQFGTLELLSKHQQMSDLHKNNLTSLRQTILSEEQLEHVAKVERELAYRDRAKERRDKFGIDDTPEYPKRKLLSLGKGVASSASASSSSSLATSSVPPPPISGSNIGSKMLKAMGWSEGKGLGKSNQGMAGIIEVAPRKEGAGLGAKDSSLSAPTSRKETYKDAVRRTALQRFKEMSEG